MAKYEYENPYCSFCGKTQDKVAKLIAGPEGFICDECVMLCKKIIDEEVVERRKNSKFTDDNSDITVLKPAELKAVLDDYVIGQEDAKKALSIAVYNHYKRVYFNDNDSIDLQKSNILLLGPTGVGKTLLAKTLARTLGVPFAIADATTLTEAGYVGEDVENVLLKLIQAADYDIEKAEMGIIYIDEVDKITRKSENRSITRDVSGEGVQQALLKIIEGTVANVPPSGGRKHPHQDFIQIDTTNILFICGGAFEGMEKIIEKRVASSAIGFGAKVQSKKELDAMNLLQKVEPIDLVKYGLIPEIVGRLPVITSLEALSEEMIVEIITKPKDAIIKQYKRLFELDDVVIEFSDDAVLEIAKKAVERKTGARGIRSIMEDTLSDIMYDVPSDHEISHIEITKETVIEGAEPIYRRDPSRVSKSLRIKSKQNAKSNKNYA